jgi:hypothetical protein
VNKWVATLPLGDINTEVWSSGMGWGVGLQPYPVKRKLLRILQEIQPDFVKEAKAGLWSQGKNKKEEEEGAKVTRV